MDVWVVAAAAGAGYVVQHLKSLGRSKSKWLESSPENLNNVKPQSSIIRNKLEDNNGPLHSMLSRKSFGEEMSNKEGDKLCEAATNFVTTSTSGYRDVNLIAGDKSMTYRTVSDSSYLGLLLDEQDIQKEENDILPSDISKDFTSDLLPHPSSSEIGFSYSSRRKRSSLKSRRFDSQFIKPRTSIESCLMAQLYEEHDESEEYALHPYRKPLLRPFLVSDGSRIISSALHESFSTPVGTRVRKCQLQKGGYSRLNLSDTVHGIPRLPNIVPVEFGKKARTAEKEKQSFEKIDFSKAACGDHDKAQGTSYRALIFYLGLTMGIVSSIFANKQEVEKMKCVLKQTENLVQDLQEELEMKNSFTVNELAAEDYESKDVHNVHCINDRVHSLSLEEKFDKVEKIEEKSLNEIEAELEAELQRLESSINSSSLEGKLCNLTELDPDLVSDYHEHNLRSGSFAAFANNQFHADSDESRSSTPRSCPYPVSPRELSLRLHQIIQSRLEERIKELEMALQNSQRKMKYMESEHVHPWRELSNSETQISSTHNSPIARKEQESIDEPVIINLSGEALAAYNEAYKVFTKASESDDEDFQAEFENGYRIRDDLMSRHSGSKESQEMVFDRQTEEDLNSPGNNVVCSSSDEVQDGDQEEMERLLIRQIVEKAKKGSPAVLKAQRAFFLSNIESEH